MNSFIWGLEMIICLICYANRWKAITIWSMAVFALQMSFYYGNERIYLEVIENYPIQDCKKKVKYRFLFKKLFSISYKGIPKEMYFCEIVKYIGLWLYSLVAVVVLFFSEDVAFLIGVAYFIVVYGIEFCCIFIMIKKSFLARYKLLNRYNLKYLFLTENEPYPKFIGKCRVIGETQNGNKTFATAIMIDTGEIKEKVLLQRKSEQGENAIYNIYEICNVYYIS